MILEIFETILVLIGFTLFLFLGAYIVEYARFKVRRKLHVCDNCFHMIGKMKESGYATKVGGVHVDSDSEFGHVPIITGRDPIKGFNTLEDRTAKDLPKDWKRRRLNNKEVWETEK